MPKNLLSSVYVTSPKTFFCILCGVLTIIAWFVSFIPLLQEPLFIVHSNANSLLLTQIYGKHDVNIIGCTNGKNPVSHIYIYITQP